MCFCACSGFSRMQFPLVTFNISEAIRYWQIKQPMLSPPWGEVSFEGLGCLLCLGEVDIWWKFCHLHLQDNWIWEAPILTFKCSSHYKQRGHTAATFNLSPFSAGRQGKGQPTKTRLFCNYLYLPYYNLLRDRPPMGISQQMTSWRPLAWSLISLHRRAANTGEVWPWTRAWRDVLILMDTQLNVRQRYCRLPLAACLCCIKGEQTPQWAQSSFAWLTVNSRGQIWLSVA